MLLVVITSHTELIPKLNNSVLRVCFNYSHVFELQAISMTLEMRYAMFTCRILCIEKKTDYALRVVANLS